MLLSFAISLTNRLLTNKKQVDKWKREISAWNAEFKKARKSGDKKLLAKVQKQQPAILKLQSRMMWQSMKVFLIFSIPIFLMWQVLSGFYGSNVVARVPMSNVFGYNIGGELPFFWWYLLCSYLFGFLFSRFFGLGMGST
jgi:uncharacterized membrane protein (DUF106 family)